MVLASARQGIRGNVAPAPPPGFPSFVQDDFNRANGPIGIASDSATAHDAGVWSVLMYDSTNPTPPPGSTGGVLSNQLQITVSDVTDPFVKQIIPSRLIPGTPAKHATEVTLSRTEGTYNDPLSMWMSNGTFVAGNSWYRFSWSYNGVFLTANGGVTFTTGFAPYPAGDWWTGTHVIRAERDGLTFRAYIDGALFLTDTASGDLGPTLWTPFSGNRPTDLIDNYWAGAVP